MIPIGTTNEKKTASKSCLGFLIGPVWASSVAWECGSALMASSKSGASRGSANQRAIIGRATACPGSCLPSAPQRLVQRDLVLQLLQPRLYRGQLRGEQRALRVEQVERVGN